MPQGLEVYDEQGGLVFSTGNRAFRVLTEVAVAGADGSVGVPGLAGGTAIVSVMSTDPRKDQPTPTISGNTVSWNYTGQLGSRDTGARIVVAVF